MKKVLMILITNIVLYLMLTISTIWMAGSFLIYLVKDIPFNYWSLFIFSVSLVLLTVNFFLGIAHEIKKKQI